MGFGPPLNMPNSEFSLINQFFRQPQKIKRGDVRLSIGDDCAILTVPQGKQLVVTTDTMVENTHFYPSIDAKDLGYKAVATNLSDLAAMGAEPAWVSLALTLPKIDEPWLQRFSQGLFEVLDEHQVALIGGDTTSGAVPSITITAQGFVEKDTALCRHKAEVGDYIFVSGSIGDGLAGFYLLSEMEKNHKTAVDLNEEFLIRRNFHPIPRVKLGRTLAKYKISRCALDLSDGLIGDLGHILECSHKSAVLNLEDLPCSPALVNLYGREQAEQLALQGGEDYELCFTVSPENLPLLKKYRAEFDINVTCIGRIMDKLNQPIIFKRNGETIDIKISSFEHFKNE